MKKSTNHQPTSQQVVRKSFDLYKDVYNVEITTENKEELKNMTKTNLGNTQVYQDIVKITNPESVNFVDPRITDLINKLII